MKIALIVAAARNNVIGNDNQLPWHLPQDLKYFKAATLGKPIIMGRKTFESIGKPLPGRTNIIVTRQPAWSAAGVTVARDLPTAIALAEMGGSEEVMVIGGAEIYRQSLELADRIYLTRILVDVEGDAFFPGVPASAWRVISVMPGDSDASLPHEYQVLERVV